MKKILIILFVSVLILYLPILINPNIFLNRGNDLQEFFWPIYYFTKQHILTHQSLPFWNPMFLSGAPLLPDPQAPIFYPLNFIYLILPLNAAFIFSSILHTFIGGIGAHLVAKKIFQFDNKASIIAGVLYIISPRWAGFLEAGHVGLITSHAWIPFVLFATIKLTQEIKIKWSIALAVALAAIFYTHPTTFVISAALSAMTFAIVLVATQSKNMWIKRSIFFALGAIISFGLTAIALLPQLEWVPQTNRVLLETDRQVWPQWSSISQFTKSLFNPILYKNNFIESVGTEKWISLGFMLPLLSFLGLTRLKNKYRLPIIILTILVVIMAANNTTPFYSYLLKQDWYSYTRVSTRAWFVITLATTFLGAFAFGKLEKTKYKLISRIIVALIIVELTSLSWTKILKPINNDRQIVSKDVIEYLSKDTDIFRIFCTTRCFSQQQVALNNLETIGGYSTLHQKNYYQQAWGMVGTYWDYYTLALPPIGAYKYSELDPDFASLGKYNAKYIISPHELDDPYANLETNIDGFHIYSNAAWFPRVYFSESDRKYLVSTDISVERISSNEILIDNINISKSGQLVLSEVYNTGWEATINGIQTVSVLETPNALQAINIDINTKFVRLTYKPKSYLLGRNITVATIIFITTLLAIKKKEAS